MLDLNKLRSEFEAQHSDKVFKIVKFDEATNAYCLHAHLPLTEINLSALAEINYGWDLWQKANAQAVPEGFKIVPIELSEEIAERLALERVQKPRPENDPVWVEIAERAYKSNLLAKKWELVREYKILTEASESGAEG
ncbi:hypothetical protein LDX88_13680 [Acinetobacter baumannii]|uniref:hypothetical protein n=1 Tax=Acinetobacter baumannii TaxID=470 RepID=UPI001CDD900F|nr:hypothetical protein [Acinetobacter baumannii]MCA4370797.1 hypothetical protein [Acinetobacter baumannii]